MTAMSAPRQKQLAAIAALWLTGLLLVLPFSFNVLLLLPGKTIPFFDFHWMALAIGLAAISLLPWAGESHSICIPYSVVALTGLIGICLYQWAAPDIPYSAPYITYITYMVWAIALFALGATLHQSLGPERLMQTIAWFSLVGALLAALTGLIQIAGVPLSFQPWIHETERGFPVGNARHPNFFSCHVMLGLLALTYLFGIRQITLRRFLPCALLLTAILAFSPSRTLYLYFLLVIMWTAWVEWKVRDMASRRFFLAIVFSFALFLLLQWGLLPLLDQQSVLSNKNAATRLLEFHKEGQLFSRIDAWMAAWKMFLQHPLLGGGIGNYSWFHFQFTNHATIGPAGNPHNLLLFYLGATGIIGTALLLAFLLDVARRLLTLRHDHRYWFPSVFLLSIITYSMLEFPLWLPAFLGTTAFLCGALNPVGWTVRANGPAKKSVFVLFIAISALALLDTFQDYRKLAWSDTGRLPSGLVDKFARNGVKNPWLRPYAERFFLRGSNLYDRKMNAALLRINARQLRWRPTHGALLQQAILLDTAGKHDESLEIYTQATLRYPKLHHTMLKFCSQHPEAGLELLCDAAERETRHD